MFTVFEGNNACGRLTNPSCSGTPLEPAGVNKFASGSWISVTGGREEWLFVWGGRCGGVGQAVVG